MPPTDVYHYFREKLGRWPSEDIAKDISIESPEGLRCVRLIDAAATLFDCMRVADTVNDYQGMMAAVDRALTYTIW